ncbi:NAD(P)-dependent oxidoreductase [Treponema primitia]|uniref:NAD-dependent epimerase/dehydratase family protein n=1 Tax=Treponema primitia TaxID=88058 RepID=UPI00397E9328
MAVFVTGGGGFLGQTLVDNLIALGHQVLVFDYNAPKEDVIARWKGKAEFRQGDIRDAKLIDDLIAESGTSDPIIHLAGILTAGCDRDPQAAIAINLGGTYNVLEGALKHGKRRVIFASTIGVYGRGLPQPITEGMEKEPDGWYGVTKLMAEQVGLLYVRRHGLDFRAVRFAAVTGAGRVAVGSASLFTSLIPEKAAKGEPYAIEVTSDTSYPVVYIKDAVSALVKLAYAPEAKSRIYNIASGNVVVDKMVDYIKKTIPDAKFSYAPVDDIMAVVSGYKEWTIGCGCAAKEIGWTPSYAVEKMVDDIIAQARTNVG